MSEDGISSAFNEGAFQMLRLNKLQDRYHALSIHPLSFNVFANKYHYEIMFETVNSLLSEVWSKLNKKERDAGMKVKKNIAFQ